MESEADMAQIVRVQRKSAVLKQPALPCLSRWHTINLLAGCPYGCRYCYARSFRSSPIDGRVHFYENTLDLLRRELPRKRVKPRVVYFSTACEPFAPYDAVLDVLYGVMELLLCRDVRVLVSTKSAIPDRFVALFEAFPGRAFVQVGLTTMDDSIRRTLEPRAGTVDARLTSLRALREHGIAAEARIDPLIPELTDMDESLDLLCRTVAACGVRTAAASYLFLRRALAAAMRMQIGDWSFGDMRQRIYRDQIDRYCGGGSVRLPSAEYRRERFSSLKKIASSHGIALRLCRCKNPKLTQDCCHPTFPDTQASQLTLDWG